MNAAGMQHIVCGVDGIAPAVRIDERFAAAEQHAGFAEGDIAAHAYRVGVAIESGLRGGLGAQISDRARALKHSDFASQVDTACCALA